jgi:pilus assembly protein Flp/PilA
VPIPHTSTSPKSLAFPALHGNIAIVAVESVPRQEIQMKKRLHKVIRGIRKQSGQSLVEYALILALIAVVAILVLQGLGSKVNNTLSSVNANLP